MTRVTRYRISYLVLLALLAGGAYFAIHAAGNSRIAFAAAIFLLLYPAPYANLAVLAAASGNAEQAIKLLAQARQLGYTGGALDRATHRVQQLLAALESRGPSV